MDNIFRIILDAQKSAPVDVIGLANRLGIEVSESELEDGVTGELVKLPDGSFQINYNWADPDTRQRFTIAHELGHYLYHRHLIGNGTNDSKMYRSDRKANHYNQNITSVHESEANQFAASLLMPGNLVEKYLEAGLNANQMAQILNVSKQAMSIRLEPMQRVRK